MNAALLNGAINAGPDETTLIVDVPQVPTNDPALDGQPIELEPTANNSFDGAQLVQLVGTMATLQDQGVLDNGQWDWAKCAAYAGTGLALGSVYPGLGNIVGAVVGVVVYAVEFLWTVETTPTPWGAPDLAAWKTYFAPQDYVTWVEANFPELALSTTWDNSISLLMYWLARDGYVAWVDGMKLPGVYDHLFMEYASLKWGAFGQVPGDGAVTIMEPAPPPSTPGWHVPIPAFNDPAKDRVCFAVGEKVYGDMFGVLYARTVANKYPAGHLYHGAVSEGTGLVYQRNVGQYAYVPGAIRVDPNSGPRLDGPRLSPRRNTITNAAVGGLAAFLIFATIKRTQHAHKA